MKVSQERGGGSSAMAQHFRQAALELVEQDNPSGQMRHGVGLHEMEARHMMVMARTTMISNKTCCHRNPSFYAGSRPADFQKGSGANYLQVWKALYGGCAGTMTAAMLEMAPFKGGADNIYHIQERREERCVRLRLCLTGRGKRT